MYNPLQIKTPKLVTPKKPLLNRPSKYKPAPGACSWKLPSKYKVKQSKNSKFSFNYKASPIDFKTQISLLEAPPNISPLQK